MKKIVIASLIISSIIFTACNSNKPNQAEQKTAAPLGTHTAIATAKPTQSEQLKFTKLNTTKKQVHR